MDVAVEAQPQEEKEMTVSLSFSLPLSLAQWVQEYMRRTKRNRSEVITAGVERLRSDEQEAAA